MGVDHSAVLFVGVEAEFREVVSKETRYDPKTGAPYEIDVVGHREIWIGDQMVLSEKDIDGERFHDGMDLDEYSDNPYLVDMDLFDDESDLYIGSEIESLYEGCENSFTEVNVKVPIHIQRLADKYKVEPKFVMYLQVG